MIDHLAFVWHNLPNLLLGFPGERPGGLALNVVYALLSIGMAFALSLPLGWGRVSPFRPIRWACALYIETLRGMPLILIVFWIFSYGAAFGQELSPFASALIGLVLFGSSYLAETLGAGLRAVPAIQIEAARSAGLGSAQIAVFIRFPQALMIALPDITSLFITIFKDSSVAVIIGAGELMYVSQVILNRSGANAEYMLSLYVAVSLLFLLGAIAVSRLLRAAEARWVRPRQASAPAPAPAFEGELA